MLYPPPIPPGVPRQVQPRQAQPVNPYLSLNFAYPAYPAYLYPNRGLSRGRQAIPNYPGNYNPMPRYYSYNIYVNLPFSGTAS